MTNWDQKWSTINIWEWGEFNPYMNFNKYFINTKKIISQIQSPPYNMWFRIIEFSILQSDKFIPRHRGVYGGQLTYQLVIYVNKNDSEKLQLNEFYIALWNDTQVPLHEWPVQYIPNHDPELLAWRENGSDIMFDDSCIHEVWYKNIANWTNDRRIVLILDPERKDVIFESSILTQFIHNYIIKKFIPMLKYWQRYICHKWLIDNGACDIDNNAINSDDNDEEVKEKKK